MKRQLLLSLTLSLLASTAFALPAADQATPHGLTLHVLRPDSFGRSLAGVDKSSDIRTGMRAICNIYNGRDKRLTCETVQT